MPQPAIPRQLSLFDARAASREERVAAGRALAGQLDTLLGLPVLLRVHDNRHTMLSFRRVGGTLHYRVHHMFLEAPGEVVRDMADLARAARGGLAHRRAAGRRIDAFVRARLDRLRAPRVGPLQPRGRAHDLQAILDRLNRAWFDGAVEARIGWGAVRTGRRRRLIQTGTYHAAARVIRIHPALDRPEVPVFYVATVVFHEMLHQAVPAREVKGRRVVHGREFRARERAYPDHERALAWERRHIRLLLASPDQ